MADPLEAAAEELKRVMVGNGGTCIPQHYNPSSAVAWKAAIYGAAEDALPSVLAVWVDSLLGELPEEAMEAAWRHYDVEGESYYDSIKVFLQALRDSLASGTS